MRSRFLLLVLLTLTSLVPALSLQSPAAAQPQTPDESGPPSLVTRVRDTGFVQLRADSFNDLSPEQKLDAYWLSQAAIAVNPIAYDQNSADGLREKHLLEAILTHPDGVDAAALKKITDYTLLFWGNAGNHNSFTSRKFVPDFTPAELKAAAGQALKNGADFGQGSNSPGVLDAELESLAKPIFDPDYQPMLTDKNPANGQDSLLASSNNFYGGVSLKDLVGFTEHYALNSRLVEKGGKLVEEVYRAGTPDGTIPPGLYAHELGLAVEDLRQALPYAPDPQKKVIDDLIRYYQTGDRADWLQCGIDWVQDKTNPDFSNGFVEVYKDARGQKGSIQGFVTVVDEKLNHVMTGFAAEAAYFEQRAPWDAKYKNPHPNPPLVNADEALIETGDFGITTIGDNLPNEQEIHQKYGSKSFIFTGSIRALNGATGQKVAEEFADSRPEIERARQYGDLAENLFTAMHEVIGHGSGMLSPKLTHDPAYYLKEYYSTLEETRADLMAMWNFFDPKLIQMGVMPNYDVARAAYDGEARAALVQLREVPTGDTIEEDHRRGTQLIVNFIRDKTGAIQPVERDGKTYLVITNYQKMREGVGMLLAELMRIKAEGDYEAAKALITQYGIHFNTAWRDQVIARYKTLDLPTYWVGINPDLELHKGANGTPDTVTIGYPRDAVKQQLRYTEIAGE
ncbi:MAG TPA: peptidase M49 [Terriglobia bacterium]|nr:peptidase M49 [Terriglobia bacterium]